MKTGHAKTRIFILFSVLQRYLYEIILKKGRCFMKKSVVRKLHRKFVSYLHGSNQNVNLEELETRDEYDLMIGHAM